jgi:hypothetical protein
MKSQISDVASRDSLDDVIMILKDMIAKTERKIEQITKKEKEKNT